MAIEQIKCWVVICDRCGKDLEYEWIPHFNSKAEAEEEAENNDWEQRKGKWLCENCVDKEEAIVKANPIVIKE